MAKISDDVGKAFETSIGNKLRVLQQLRIVAWWEHQQPAMFKLKGLWRKGAPSGADFSGILEGGRGFAVEAKSIGPKKSGAPISLVLEDDDHFSPKQREHLNAAASAGAAAFLAVQFRREAAPWVVAIIPWRDVPWERAQKHHHLRPMAALPWQLPMDRTLFEHLLGAPCGQLVEGRKIAELETPRPTDGRPSFRY